MTLIVTFVTGDPGVRMLAKIARANLIIEITHIHCIFRGGWDPGVNVKKRFCSSIGPILQNFLYL